jgi:hypothetical protein
MTDYLGSLNSSRNLQVSSVISFFVSIRKPLSTSHETSDEHPNNFTPGTKQRVRLPAATVSEVQNSDTVRPYTDRTNLERQAI